MKKYTNLTANTLRFDHEGKEYVVGPGDSATLPDSDRVSALVARGYLKAEEPQPSKKSQTEKNDK
jgi:hypothetical protein